MARPKKTETAKITWLGEDDLYEDGNGPTFNTWNGIKFKKGLPVDVTNAHMIAKARGNRFYEVSGGDVPAEPAEASEPNA